MLSEGVFSMEIQPIISINSIKKTAKINPDDKRQKHSVPVVKKNSGNSTQYKDDDTDAEHIDEFV